jgi:RNA recognition motif-containing protein
MGRKLYVGNLPYSATEASLREAFAASGTVDSVSVITDRDTGQSKGFAFVEMSSDSEAQRAIQAMNGQSIDGRQIKVNEAKPKESGGGRRERMPSGARALQLPPRDIDPIRAQSAAIARTGVSSSKS